MVFYGENGAECGLQLMKGFVGFGWVGILGTHPPTYLPT